MTDTEYKIKVMQAYMAGEDIEFLDRHDPDKVWKDLDRHSACIWDWSTFNYRIKVELPSVYSIWGSEGLTESDVVILGVTEDVVLYALLPQCTVACTTVEDFNTQYQLVKTLSDDDVKAFDENNKTPERFDIYSISGTPVIVLESDTQSVTYCHRIGPNRVLKKSLADFNKASHYMGRLNTDSIPDKYLEM